MDEPNVSLNEAEERYELYIGDSLVGFADVRVVGDSMQFPYVEVDPQHRGKGLGERLLREALADARSKGLKIVPICPFVVAYVRRHPEYAS